MSSLFTILLISTVFVASLALTGWFRRQALEHRLLDVPNSRSSHTTATPRGGGVAIVLSALVAFLALGWVDRLAWRSVSSLCVGGALVALIGIIDDRRHVSARWRLSGHFVAATWVLTQLGGAPRLTVMGFVLDSGWLGFVIGGLYLVWMLNLTNFMDGIDGIAGVETITVCLSGALLNEMAAPGQQLWIAPLVLASATLGFLVWNWPPARIFMGNAGSGFLGFTLAVLSLQAGFVSGRLFWGWTILFGVFVVDATVTLIRRMVRGERVYEAHRSHAYQHAALQRGSHQQVTVMAGVINIVWLLPIALMVALGVLNGILGVFVAYAPLVLAAIRLRAGKPSIP